MATGTLAVRDALGPNVPGITDAEIREALWHYYYDVGKTVTWLLDSRIEMKATDKGKSGKKKKKGGFHFCRFGAGNSGIIPDITEEENNFGGG
jgi:hypothetical protein